MSSELHFQPTDAFRSAWKRVLAHADALPSDRMNDVNVLRSISIETSKGIPFSTIKLVSALYKQLVTIKGKSKIESTTTTENGTSGYTGDGSLYSLMQGISLVKEAKKSKGYSKAFEAELQQMRLRQQRREYLELVKDLPSRKDGPGSNKGFGSLPQVTKDLAIGTNIILLMFTGFSVFYYAGNSLFYGDKIKAIACGAIGLICALILETCILIIRDRQSIIMEDREKKDKLLGIRTDVGPTRYYYANMYRGNRNETKMKQQSENQGGGNGDEGKEANSRSGDSTSNTDSINDSSVSSTGIDSTTT